MLKWLWSGLQHEPHSGISLLENVYEIEASYELVCMNQNALVVFFVKLNVDYCREIIEKYPDSSYAPRARRMLRDIPRRYRKLYKITDEEMGL